MEEDSGQVLMSVNKVSHYRWRPVWGMVVPREKAGLGQNFDFKEGGEMELVGGWIILHNSLRGRSQ